MIPDPTAVEGLPAKSADTSQITNANHSLLAFLILEINMLLLDLPVELIANVFFHVGALDLIRCQATCKDFSRIIKKIILSAPGRTRWLNLQGGLAETASDIEDLLSSSKDSEAAANIYVHTGLEDTDLRRFIVAAAYGACSQTIRAILHKHPDSSFADSCVKALNVALSTARGTDKKLESQEKLENQVNCQVRVCVKR